jgi:2-C-methyl-D-erythritol 4-phosphate cytidylyltransferase
MTAISVILLAGGQGTRMRSATPKQYLPLGDKPLAHYSFELFMAMPEVAEIIVVCDVHYRHLFTADTFPAARRHIRLAYALPGVLRQDSVFNGLQASWEKTPLVCIHDAARPCITPALVRRVIEAAEQYGAATASIPVKHTIKQSDQAGFVRQTLDRSTLHEIQTPQIMRFSLLREGFALAHRSNSVVTDDVSLVELLNHPVKLVEGSYTNLKVTTPEDLTLALHFIPLCHTTTN